MSLSPPSFVKKRLKKIWIENIQPALRERIYDKEFLSRPGHKENFEYVRYFFKFASLPFFRDRLPEFDPSKSNISWIPINRDIEGAGEIALPEEILDRLIEKAKHRVIIDFCGCRLAKDCSDYPSDIGCLMMGESALKIPRKVSREVGIKEAKAHIRKAFKAGLIPITGKARIDNDILMIPDESKLLTVCLCCECCCITRFNRYMPPEVIAGIHHPVEGLSIEVTDDCIGCGACTAKCYIQAIEVQGGRAVIGRHCRLCGRCAASCPNKAIKLKLDNPHAVDDVVERIEAIIDF